MERLLIKMSKLGIGGKMYNWILDFLSNRTFRVKVGSDMSSEFKTENGIKEVRLVPSCYYDK